jgi:4-diphosphocytidyl-2-C-methyl-D-erythritol kinase
VLEAAPAKLNLYLHVLGRRADGYHRLDSLVVFTRTGDTLRAEPADDFSLVIDGPFAAGLSTDDDNLVLKAARALSSLSSRTSTRRVRDPGSIVPPERWTPDQVRGDGKGGQGARLTLTKNLPVASGIGGGSADAAAALRLLRRLWRLDIGDAQLHGVAAALGADVPACLRGEGVFLGGVGEVLTPAPVLPPLGLVLVNPGIPLPTPDVFAARRGPFSEPARFSETPVDARALAALLVTRRNDLEGPAISLVPAIATVLEALRATPGCHLARLSGSGATGFGLYDTPEAASHAAASIARREPGWWVAPTRLAD